MRPILTLYFPEQVLRRPMVQLSPKVAALLACIVLGLIEHVGEDQMRMVRLVNAGLVPALTAIPRVLVMTGWRYIPGNAPVGFAAFAFHR